MIQTLILLKKTKIFKFFYVFTFFMNFLYLPFTYGLSFYLIIRDTIHMYLIIRK